MPLALAKADKKILARRKVIINGLRKLVGKQKLIVDDIGLNVFQSDAFAGYHSKPLVVVLPETTEEVAAILRFCSQAGVKVVPRGAGTSLTGGALPSEDSVVVCMTRMDQILEISLDDRTVRVQAGVTNKAVSDAVSGNGFFYAPDPVSKLACTIGGNIATNAGGQNAIKYGLTVDNVLGVRLVTIEGEVIELGGDYLDHMGYDLRTLVIGSEGQLGIVTEATVKVLPTAESSRPMLIGFASTAAAAECAGAILSAGIIPQAMELMDRTSISVCQEYVGTDYPKNVEAILIVEIEGAEVEIDQIFRKVNETARQHEPVIVKISESKEESEAIWKGFKGLTTALAKLSDCYVVDGSVPAGRLADILKTVAGICKGRQLRVANTCHVGDGNLHSVILYDSNNPDEFNRVEQAASEILKACIEVGGCLTGEHGIGVEKRDLMTAQFTREELAQQMRIKDAFDADWLLNPGKVFPLELHR